MEAKAPSRRSRFMAAAAALSAQTQDRDYAGPNPVRYPDPDIISLDKRFDKYRLSAVGIPECCGPRAQPGTAVGILGCRLRGLPVGSALVVLVPQYTAGATGN